jgi:HSP20 family protein
MTTLLTPRSSRSAQQPAVLKLMDGDPFFQRMRKAYNAIARRAYELFESRGRQTGHDWEDWFQAEFELLNPMPVEISEANDELIVRADAPGFRNKDIEVRVEPHRLIISGKREEFQDGKKGKTLYSERRSNEVFRMLDLPEEIDPNNVKATLRDGALEVELPKAHGGRKIPLASRAA